MVKLIPLAVIVLSVVGVSVIFCTLEHDGQKQLLIEIAKGLIAGGVGGVGVWWFNEWKKQEETKKATAEACTAERQRILERLLREIPAEDQFLMKTNWWNTNFESAGTSLV